MPLSSATSRFSVRWSNKARSSCLWFSSAAKVYFSSPSANAALSARFYVIGLWEPDLLPLPREAVKYDQFSSRVVGGSWSRSISFRRRPI
jgi:hypothetical protein